MSLVFPLPMPVLETPRLLLRRFQQDDLEEAFSWASDDEVTRYVFWSTNRNRSETQQFLDYCFQEYEQRGIGPWAVELKETGTVIGECAFGGIHAADLRIEIAYFFARPHWGKGLALEALLALLRFGFEELGVNRMEARCMVPNTASERVMQKAGMQYEGTLRELVFAKERFHDMKVYSLLRVEWMARAAL
jgi:ribosomal-protein-alanine N-acetyltransferase